MSLLNDVRSSVDQFYWFTNVDLFLWFKIIKYKCAINSAITRTTTRKRYVLLRWLRIKAFNYYNVFILISSLFSYTTSASSPKSMSWIGEV